MWMDCLNFNIPMFYGDIGKNHKKKLASFKNNISFQNTFARLVLDALERYELEGLPETISERVTLQSFLWYAGAVFFEKSGSLYALPAAPSGDGFNIYGDPASAWVFSKNGVFNEEVSLFIPGSDESKFLTETNAINLPHKLKGVYVWENKLRYPFVNYTMFFASAIADTMRTLDVCRTNIKNPFIITAEESVVPTVKKYMEQRDNNEEYVLSSGIFDASKVSVIPLVTNSDSLNSCTELIEWYENKYKELCGVDNNGQMDKKGENLISTEITINNMYTEMSVDKCIDTINEGLDSVNKIYGTSIRCVPKHRKEEPQNDDIRGNGGDDNTRTISQ